VHIDKNISVNMPVSQEAIFHLSQIKISLLYQFDSSDPAGWSAGYPASKTNIQMFHPERSKIKISARFHFYIQNAFDLY